MDNPFMMYLIAAAGLVTYFLFCIITTMLFAKLVLSWIPGGSNKDENNEIPEGETSKTPEGPGQSGPDTGSST